MNHKLDTDSQVFFYEQDFYVLSNFSAFSLVWKNSWFPTTEHAYHWEKFPNSRSLQSDIRTSISAHEAFKLAERNKEYVRADWSEVRPLIMRQILWAKVQQHEYVKRKLLATGDRDLIEDSWRDSYWGWGPDRQGKNALGALWMDIRNELRTQSTSKGVDNG